MLSHGTRHIPIDGRLYLPNEGLYDRQHCWDAGIPEEAITARSKAEHVLAMVVHARAEGVRFAFAGPDAGHGKDPPLLHAMDAAGEPALFLPRGFEAGGGRTIARERGGVHAA